MSLLRNITSGLMSLFRRERVDRELESMSIVFQDARYGLRMVAKNPGFAAAAVITLALGIGAATTIFSVIDNVLLDPFPYVDAQRIVMITIHNDAGNRPGGRAFFRRYR